MSRRVEIPESELAFEFSTSGGPGGQNVNKVATKVRVTFDIVASAQFSTDEKSWLLESPLLRPFLIAGGILAVTSQKSRSQAQNREDALEKLHSLLSVALRRPKKRRPTRATKASRERRLKSKKERGDRKSGRRKPSLD